MATVTGAATVTVGATGNGLTGEQPIGFLRRQSPPLLVSFLGGDTGQWKIDSIAPVIGPSLPEASRLSVTEGPDTLGAHGIWNLRGVTGNTRYTHRHEADALTARQEGLNRSKATRAALIPIRKTERWWALAQDERRSLFEERSHHISIGMDYLPAIARRLHHSRELGEPFDFLTWFEYAPEDSDAFEALVGRLRATEEWKFIDREVDIRLSRT